MSLIFQESSKLHSSRSSLEFNIYSVDENYRSYQESMQNSLVINLDNGDIKNEKIFNLFSNLVKLDYRDKVFTGLTTMVYSVVVDSGYDEYGSKVEGEKIVTKIKLQTDDNITRVKTSNAKEVIFPISADQKSFKACIEEKLAHL